MAKFKIGWNDGHTLSGVGTGAVGLIKETDRNRRIGSKVRKILLEEYNNVEIVNCTVDYSSNDMGEAVTIANNNDCDLFVSNHVNAGGGYGFETFYSRKSTQSNINHAKTIHKHLVKTKSCLMDRRCCDDYSYKGYDLYVLINTKMEAVLCEIGFVDNQECINAVNDDEVARAYASGIAEAYGLTKKVNNNSNTNNNVNVKEEYKMKYAVCYTNSVDERAAKYLRDYLGDEAQVFDATIPMGDKWSRIAPNIIAVGGDVAPIGFSSYTTHKIKGDNRYSTAMKVLEICTGKVKLDTYKVK